MRTVTEHEMSRRQKMAAAKCDLTDAMAKHELTAMEWVNVLNEMLSRMVVHGLTEEWADDDQVDRAADSDFTTSPAPNRCSG